MDKNGAERARLYLDANQGALEKYRALCKTIDCDFEEKDAFVYSLDDQKKIDRELKALDRLGFGENGTLIDTDDKQRM